ncbi:glutamate carboxypeptidase 2-like isoform X2 [Haemaphysalis longicornis]
MALQRRGSRTPPMSPGRGAMSPGRGAMSPAQKIRMAAVQQRKQYARTPAERLLLKWVICWVLFAAVATTFMLWYLFKLAEKPVVTDHMSRLLSIHDHISTEKYRQHDRIFNAIMHNITAKVIKQQFNDMTTKDTGGRDLIRAVARYWRELGMDVVKVPTYMMLATRPNTSFDNKGRAVYVNYGRIQDYGELNRQEIQIRDSVVLARTGEITTSEKVRNAEQMGAVGIVIFLNPDHAAPFSGESAFPNSMWVDGNAIPRDSAAYVLGDPLTPGIPSSFGANPLAVENSAVPAIPAQPISYGNAAEIMKYFTEKPCPKAWEPNLGVGGCYLMGGPGLRFQVLTHNQHVHITTPNVIGIIRGKVEPDRFVVVGSHTSENTRGSAEPLLSVAKMVVQSKVFAALHKQKRWTPRRSIIFALFYGERPSFEGATEWVEDHLAALQNGAVLFITSGMFSGGMFVPKAMPGLSWSLRHVTNLVYSNDTVTMLKEWEERKNSTVAVAMPPMGLGDDAPFSFTAGIPTAFMHYMNPLVLDDKYPAVGTAYDSYSMVEKMDPNFHWIRMEAQASALLTRFWADRTLLPLDVLEMAEWINLRAKEFEVNYRDTFNQRTDDTMEPVLSSAKQFVDSARYFMNWTQRIRPDSPIYVRIYNDIVLRISRVFLIPGGIPTRDVTHKNVLFSPKGRAFPGLLDLVHKRPFDDKAFGRHVAFIAECIIQATEILHFLPIAQ